MSDATLLFGIVAMLAVWMGINVLRIWSRNRAIRRLSAEIDELRGIRRWEP